MKTTEENNYHGNTVEHWRKNAQQDYLTTPISVLKYITILEEQSSQLQVKGGVSDEEIDKSLSNAGDLVEFFKNKATSLQSKLLEKEKEVAKLKQELIDSASDDHYNYIVGCNEKIKSLQSELSEQKLFEQSLNVENMKFIGTIQELTAELEAVKRERDFLIDEREKLTKQVADKDFDYEELKSQAEKIRPSVRWFAERMEAKLAKNDHKGGWGSCELQYLSMRLTQERKELTEAIKSKDKQRIIDECADIANFSLMIADRYANNFGN